MLKGDVSSFTMGCVLEKMDIGFSKMENRKVKRRRYSAEFKQEAVRCTVMKGQSVAEVAERLGIIECFLGLEVTGGGLSYLQTRAALVVGPWRPPLPSWLSPRVEATETPVAEGDLVHVEVQLSLPPLGVLMSYIGDVRVDRKATA